MDVTAASQARFHYVLHALYDALLSPLVCELAVDTPYLAKGLEA